LLGSAAPGGLELPERVVGDLEQAATIGVHHIEVSILVRPGRGAMREEDLRAVRRPGWPAVALVGGQLHQVRAVRQDRVELRRGVIGEGAEGLEEDALTVGRPVLIARLQFPGGQLLEARAIAVDEEQRLLVPRPIRLAVARKEDVRAIGRPGGRVIRDTGRQRGIGELPGMAAISLHDPEALPPRPAVGTNGHLGHTVDYLAAIRRPSAPLSAVAHVDVVGELLEAAPVGVHHPDIAGATGSDTREEDFGAIGGPLGKAVLLPLARLGELAHVAAVGLGREDRGRGLVRIQKALPGDAPFEAGGGLRRPGRCRRHAAVLAWCGLPTGGLQRGQQAEHE